MKYAKILTAAVEVLCPECGLSVGEPQTGSFLWPTNEQWPATIKCEGGHEMKLKLPKRVEVA